MPQAVRTSQATDESLSLTLAGVEKAHRKFTLGREADGVGELDQLWHTSAGWAPHARLSTKVARLRRTVRRLSRTVRRLDHLAGVRQQQGRPEDPGSVRWWDRWLIRLPVYSLFVWMGVHGMHQWGWVAMSGTLLVAGVGVLLVALWQLRQQARGRRPQ